MKNKNYIIENDDLMKEWDYEKNKNLDPKTITNGSSKKAWWICPKGHSYYTKISNRTKSKATGCPVCAGRKIIIGINDLETWCKNNNRLDLIREFDKEKNNFTMQDISSGSGKKVWWICPEGHSYQTYLTHRTRMNTGCGICSHKKFQEGVNDLLTTHPEIAKEWDYKKNKISPSEVMAGSNNKKYWFICPKGHSYKTTLLGRKHGTNCPICNQEHHISFPEKAILYYLKQYIKNIVPNYKLKKQNNKEIDIYLPDFKIGIEYDGGNFHKNIQRDLHKDLICDSLRIKLIRIREKGCPKYESNSLKYYVDYNKKRDLENTIVKLIKRLNLDESPNINIERDKIEIYELMEMQEKENSILKKRKEILEYWDKEKNGNILPDFLSYSSRKTIYLKCKNGHSWKTTPQNFYNSPWCPYCSGYKIMPGYNDLGTKYPELCKEWSINNSDTPDCYSFASNKKKLWICSNCGNEFLMTISARTLRNNNCPYCSNHQLLSGYNDFATRYPDYLKEWDYEKNKISPNQIFPSYNKKVWWICPKGHEYEMSVRDKCKGGKCTICSNYKLLKGYNDLETCNPMMAKEFDKEKNNLKPSEIIYGGTKKYWWKCQKGHSFYQAIRERINGQKCPYCSGKFPVKGETDLKTINPLLAREWNYDKNKNLIPESFLPNSGKKVWWICSNCGYEWEETIFSRNRKKALTCPQCHKKIKF